MKNALWLSFWLSLVSVVIVLFIPFDISIRESDKVYSPYNEEIEELLKKSEKGISAEESEYIDELIDKNNQWFAENRQHEVLRYSAKGAWSAWQKKSALLSPVIGLFWGICFYFFYRRHRIHQTLWVVAVPVLLTGTIMPYLEVALIVLVVLVIWFVDVLDSRI